MSQTYEEHIKYKIERELEHLAWLKRNMPTSQRLIDKSVEKIRASESKLREALT